MESSASVWWDYAMIRSPSRPLPGAMPEHTPNPQQGDMRRRGEDDHVAPYRWVHRDADPEPPRGTARGQRAAGDKSVPYRSCQAQHGLGYRLFKRGIHTAPWGT